MNSRAWSTAESATRTESVRMYVINPTGPSSPTSTPSYSCCAIRIVIAAEKPSCFAASCCSVLVRNGGGVARGLLRVHLALVDLQRVRERLPDGVLRDLVEQHAADLGAVAQGLRHVPGDRLTLAVGVGGDEHALRLLRRLLDLGEGLRLLLDGDVLRREAVVDVHAQLALRQVADVSHGRLDGVARAEVLADRLRLGGRLDDDERAPTSRQGPGLRRARLPAARLRLRVLHITLLSSHASTFRQTKRERASLPSRPALRKPRHLSGDLLLRFAIGIDDRVRFEIRRVALLQQLTHARHGILSY